MLRQLRRNFLTPCVAANYVRHNRDQPKPQLTADILRETKVSREHLTPEIALHLITNECHLFHKPIIEPNDKVFQEDPYWGFYWPGGQALSRFILDNDDVVRHKSVLDVGSGCGATSFAALKCGASYVVANDIDQAAGIATQLNATLNGISSEKLHICQNNYIGSSKVAEDIVLLGDLFYDDVFAEIMMPWLLHLRCVEHKTILVGDPGRHGLTPSRLRLMRLLASYELTTSGCIENNGFSTANVWTFK